MEIGRFELCLNVADLNASIEFYQKLGFREVDGNRDKGYSILSNGRARIALYHGHIHTNLLNFRGGDVFAIIEELKAAGVEVKEDASREADGSAAATVLDPDGNIIFFNTFPNEPIEVPDLDGTEQKS